MANLDVAWGDARINFFTQPELLTNYGGFDAMIFYNSGNDTLEFDFFGTQLHMTPVYNNGTTPPLGSIVIDGSSVTANAFVGSGSYQGWDVLLVPVSNGWHTCVLKGQGNSNGQGAIFARNNPGYIQIQSSTTPNVRLSTGQGSLYNVGVGDANVPFEGRGWNTTTATDGINGVVLFGGLNDSIFRFRSDATSVKAFLTAPANVGMQVLSKPTGSPVSSFARLGSPIYTSGSNYHLETLFSGQPGVSTDYMVVTCDALPGTVKLSQLMPIGGSIISHTFALLDGHLGFGDSITNASNVSSAPDNHNSTDGYGFKYALLMGRVHFNFGVTAQTAVGYAAQMGSFPTTLPQIVEINTCIGHNDTATGQGPYTTAMETIINKLSTSYPNAKHNVMQPFQADGSTPDASYMPGIQAGLHAAFLNQQGVLSGPAQNNLYEALSYLWLPGFDTTNNTWDKVHPKPGNGTSSYGYDAITAQLANFDTPDTTAPSVPTGITNTPVNWVQIVLAWPQSTDVDNPSSTLHYTVKRDGTLVWTGGQDVRTFTDLVLADNTAHIYTVNAVDPIGNASAYSANFSVTYSVTGGGGSGGAVGVGTMGIGL